jgi:hypothetical protein
MIISFYDDYGVQRFRTLTRLNVRKVAESIQKSHSGHPLSQTVAVLEQVLRKGKDEAKLVCLLPRHKRERRRRKR